MKRAICILLLTAIYAIAYAGDGLTLSTVVIDPGHGGKDPGAVSKDKKTYEKTLVLDISRKLADKIRAAYPDVNVILTRDSDEFVSLDGRASIANKADANLFISIHINSSTSSNPNGYSLHLLGQSSNKNKDLFAYNMDVCKLENSVISLEDDQTKYEGFNPDDPESQIFAMLMQSAYLEQSLKFAQYAHSAFDNGPIKADRGVWQNPFYVLWKTSMPSVLVEVGFISNSADLAILRDASDREKIANNLFVAFKKYKSLYDESTGVVLKETVTAPEASAEIKPVVESKPIVEEKPVIVDKPVETVEVAVAAVTAVETVPETTAPATSHLFKMPETKQIAEEKKNDSQPVIKKEEQPVVEQKVAPSEKVSDTDTVVTSEKKTEVQYGVQIFAISRVLYPGAKEFLGYDASVFRVGSVNKYVIGRDSDLRKVENNLKEIRKKYPDAFIVKIEGEKIEMYKR